MNLSKEFSSLRFQTVAPPILVLIIFLITFSGFGWVISTRFSNLQRELSLNTSATRSLLEIARIRGNSKEILLLYRLTKETKYLGQLNENEMENSIQFNRLRSELNQIDHNDVLVNSFFAGSDDTRELRNGILEAIARNDDESAARLFSDYSIFYEINNARLADMHAMVHSRITQAETAMLRLLQRTPYFLIGLLLTGFFASWIMAKFYKRRVLNPLLKLQRGFGSVSRGVLGKEIMVPSVAVEIKEMLQDFNKMTKHLEQITIDLNAARESAEKSANVKSEFLSNMSHEIRTPLNVIVGLADLLNERVWEPEAKKEVEIIRKSSSMLLGIVNDILDYSRLESGKISVVEEPFDLWERMKNVGLVVEPLAKAKGIQLLMDIASDVPKRIIGDSQLLEQALLNLVNNAIKFTSQGKVTIRARADFKEGATFLEVMVIDSGIGIQPDKIEKLFTRFTQADSSITRSHGGTGLGLAIVKQIALFFKGDVSVKSVYGEGSQFTIRFPVQIALKPQEMNTVDGSTNSPALVAVGEAARTEAVGDQRPIKVLLADDSPDNRFLITKYLEPLNVEIIEAENGNEALNEFKKGKFDIILMDIQMPEVDGYQATREMRRIEKELSLVRTPVIALTAFALKEEVERTLASGCDSHMTKPIRKKELIQAIEDFL